MNKKTKELVLAAILTALSIIITYSPVKLVLPFFTLTIGAHVPTMLAAFISPWVVIMTVIGSCLGFFMTIPAPNSIIVIARAATHIFFALAGYNMIKKGKLHILLIVLITAIIHSLSEGVIVYILTPLVLTGDTLAGTAAVIAIAGTFLHHLIDSAICIPVLIALKKAKVINTNYKF